MLPLAAGIYSIGVFYKQSLVAHIKVTSHSEHVVWIRIQNETTSKNDS